jgi:disulfide oxidoreductase YuzD
MTEFYLRLRHGSAVGVQYIDLAEPEAQEQFPEVLAVIEEQNLPYPLVAINGQLRLAGTAHYYRVVALVEEMLETEHAS